MNSALFVFLLNPLVPRLRRSPWAAAALDGVNVGAVAVMAAVMVKLGREILVTPSAWTIAVFGALATFLPRKLPPALVVVGGALLGLAFHLLGS